jgi:hypothetical protein
LYDAISQAFLAFFVIAYLVILGALAWRALGGRVRSARKNPVVAAPVERKGGAVLRLFSRKEKNSVADGYQRQLHSVIVGPPLEVQESHDDGPTRFLLSSKYGELRRHCNNVESSRGTHSSLR